MDKKEMIKRFRKMARTEDMDYPKCISGHSKFEIARQVAYEYGFHRAVDRCIEIVKEADK